MLFPAAPTEAAPRVQCATDLRDPRRHTKGLSNDARPSASPVCCRIRHRFF
jgi:single CXXC unit